MTPQDKILAKYIGSMFGTIVGGYIGDVRAIAASYNGNTQAMMRDLSGSAYFTNTLVAGSPRDIAHDLVNRIAGDTAAAGERAWAVDWMEGSHAAGRTWGEIIFEAVSALEGITSGPWAATAGAMRARAEYNATATEGWAWNVTNLDTLRDVYSAAVTPSGFTPSVGNPAAIDQLLAANASLATAAAGLGGQSLGSTYTVSGADTGRAIMMGDGNDIVTIGFGDLDKLALLSGGAGADTLIVTQSAGIDAYLSRNGGFFDDQPIRGFEKIVFQGFTPTYFGAIPGTKEVTFGGYGVAFDTTLVGVENGMRINLQVDSTSYLRFSDTARYNNSGPFSQAPQPVESIEVNVQGTAAGSRAYLSAPPAKDLAVTVNAPANSAFGWNLHFNGNTYNATPMPHLETLTIASSVNVDQRVEAPNLRGVDLAGTTGLMRFTVDGSGGAARADGVHDAIVVTAPQSAIAFKWSSQALPYADTTINFVGEFRAGSQLVFNNDHTLLAKNLPITKAVFGSDFSQVGALKAAGLSQQEGSVFDVTGVEMAAVYFKGTAPSGKSLGTVSFSDRQTTIIKVDAAQDMSIKTQPTGGVGVIINNGAGSVLDNVRSSLESQVGTTFNLMTVEGGRILWADLDGNGELGGQTILFPWKVTPDLVVMETSSSNLATMSTSVVAMGFNPLFDPFAL